MSARLRLVRKQLRYINVLRSIDEVFVPKALVLDFLAEIQMVTMNPLPFAVDHTQRYIDRAPSFYFLNPAIERKLNYLSPFNPPPPVRIRIDGSGSDYGGRCRKV